MGDSAGIPVTRIRNSTVVKTNAAKKFFSKYAQNVKDHYLMNIQACK